MKNKRRFAMVSVAVIVVALLLEAGILKYVNDANAYRLSKLLLVVLSLCSIKMTRVRRSL